MRKKMLLRHVCVLTLVLAALSVPQAVRADTLPLGDAGNYGLLFTGYGANTLQITNVSILGNIGVASIGLATDSGPSTVNGSINFAAANTGQFSNNNAGNVITGGVHFGVGTVTSALNTVTALNSTLGAESGTNLAINGNTTVNITNGILDANCDYVFNVTSYNMSDGQLLTINGDGVHNVVFNFKSSANLKGDVVLNNIGGDSVLYNFVGGSGGTGGPTMQLNTNASSYSTRFWQGVILDPNGAMSLTNANLEGRVFGGDTHDFQYVSGTTIDTPPFSPVPEPSSLFLSLAGLAWFGSVAIRKRLKA